MPKLSQEIVDNVSIHKLAVGKTQKQLSRNIRILGTTVGSAWLIGSLAATLTEKGPTSFREKKAPQGIVQAGFNLLIDHPYRVAGAALGLAADEGYELDFSNGEVKLVTPGSDRPAVSVDSSVPGGQIDGMPVITSPGGSATTVVESGAPVEVTTGTPTAYTPASDIGVWPAVREACGLSAEAPASDVAARIQASGMSNNAILLAGVTVNINC